MQVQARALGDPTRFAIFSFIAERDGLVDVAGLVDELGITHNAIRHHLAKLEDAHLVVHSTEEDRAVAGRPRLQYRVHPAAVGAWGTRCGFETLALLLIDMLKSGESPRAVGRQSGLRLRLGGQPSSEPLRDLLAQLEVDGLDPMIDSCFTRTDIVMRRCAYESAAIAAPDIVCEAHLGRIQGMVEAFGGFDVDGLVVRDPRAGGCILQCRVQDGVNASGHAAAKGLTPEAKGRKSHQE